MHDYVLANANDIAKFLMNKGKEAAKAAGFPGSVNLVLEVDIDVDGVSKSKMFIFNPADWPAHRWKLASWDMVDGPCPNAEFGREIRLMSDDFGGPVLVLSGFVETNGVESYLSWDVEIDVD